MKTEFAKTFCEAIGVYYYFIYIYFVREDFAALDKSGQRTRYNCMFKITHKKKIEQSNRI